MAQTGHGLRVAAIGPLLSQKPSFVVGVNAAVDLIVSATEFMQAMKLDPASAPHDVDKLDSFEDLQAALSFFYPLGIAAERWMNNASHFARAVQVASKLPSAQYFIGGNAALMGQHLVECEGAKVEMVAAVGPQLLSLLPKGLVVPAVSLAATDEVHIILEYGKGEAWGKLAAGRANRFIFSHDNTNAELLPLDWLASAVAAAAPDIVVVSGVHMLEGQPQHVRQQRVQQLQQAIATMPPAPVHVELASIADPALIQVLDAHLFPTVDSIGLNEQELFAVAKTAGGPHAHITSQPVTVPAVAVVADLIHWLFQKYAPRLTRVHFHSLTFHVLALKEGSWSGVRLGAAAASLVASQRACASGLLTEELFDLPFPRSFSLHVADGNDEPLAQELRFNPEDPVVTWQRDGINYALVPVLVCRKPVKTVGLGDAISASGLLHTPFGSRGRSSGEREKRDGKYF